MAQFMKLLVAIALTFAVTIATSALEDPFKDVTSSEPIIKIRPNRFVAQKDDGGLGPKARYRNSAATCNGDSEICGSTGASSTMTCCNKKCLDLSTDKENCGACENKCGYDKICCGGECVYWRYNTLHCGGCNHRCKPRASCYDGECEYVG